MQFGFAYAPPLVIGAAVSNKVFDSLASGAKTVEQLSKETGASPRGLRAIMNALVGLELLKKDRHGNFSLTTESEAFLLSSKPGTLAGFFRTILPQLISRWLQLTDVVRTGRPVMAVNQETEGTQFFTGLVENIIPMSYGGAQKLGDHLKLAKAKGEVRVLDLAAGSGIWGIALAQKSPRVRVTVSNSSKAICWKPISATATTSPRSATFCTAKARSAAVSCSRKPSAPSNPAERSPSPNGW